MADNKKIPYNAYLINGELHIGVSAILNTESMGDFLLPWALRTFGGEDNPIEAHQQYMESVSNIGTQIHKFIEMDLAGENAQALVNEQTVGAIEAWLEWKKNHKVEVVVSEKQVHHTDWRCAGTLDAVLKIDGELYVVDFKTGKFKPRYFTQLAAYKAMLQNEPKKTRISNIENARLAVLEILRDGDPVKLITLEDKYGKEITEEDELGIFHALRYVWYLRNMKSKQYQPVIKNMDVLLNPMHKDFKKTFKLGEK